MSVNCSGGGDIEPSCLFPSCHPRGDWHCQSDSYMSETCIQPATVHKIDTWAAILNDCEIFLYLFLLKIRPGVSPFDLHDVVETLTLEALCLHL